MLDLDSTLWGGVVGETGPHGIGLGESPEGERVRRALPDVEVVGVPEEPAEFVRTLQSGLWFEAVGLTSADRERAGPYTVERRRRESRGASTALDDYLRSPEMTAEVRPIDDAEMPRVVQLLGKTDQFNMIGVPDEGDRDAVRVDLWLMSCLAAVRVDLWLMSCLILGRTAEQFTLRQFLERAMTPGGGEFLPAKKNALVADLYDRLGFARDGLDLERAGPPVTSVAAA